MRELGRIIVTGGAAGLGAAVAQAIADAGGTPIVFDRQPARAGLDDRVVDLADTAATEAAVRDVAADGLGGVVTAAGIDACGPFDDVGWEDWERVVRVNLFGTAAVVRAALPALRASHGTIVTVASTLGLRALPDATAYCASKFGVVGLTRALACELGGEVGVTLLVPGGMQTSFFEGRPEQYQPPPDLRLNDPADVAQAVVFALRQPLGCEVRELVMTPSAEPSWP